MGSPKPIAGNLNPPPHRLCASSAANEGGDGALGGAKKPSFAFRSSHGSQGLDTDGGAGGYRLWPWGTCKGGGGCGWGMRGTWGCLGLQIESEGPC